MTQPSRATRRTVTPSRSAAQVMSADMRTVMKADPQMGSVLANIQSLLQQLQAMSGAAAADGGAGSVAMEEEDYVGPLFQPGSAQPSRVEGEEEMEDEDEEGAPTQGLGDVAPDNVAGPDGSRTPQRIVKRGKAKKAIIVGDPDASTGSGSAEERIEDLPEWDEENIGDIAKGIIRMLTKGRQPINKALGVRQPSNTATTATLVALTQALTGIAKRQTHQEQVLEDLLDGMGVTKQLEAEEEAQVQKSAGRHDVQANI